VLVLITIGPRIANSIVKEAVQRPRPSAHLLHVSQRDSGYGFPSGHTVGTAVLFGVLFFIIPAAVPWRPVRWLLQLGCLLLIASAGPARVYVGVHWPSDVLASYLLALLFLMPVFLAYHALTRTRTRSQPEPRMLD
jgi:undecaprenyl-diphosphatase